MPHDQAVTPRRPDEPLPRWIAGGFVLLGALYLACLNPHYDFRAYNAHDPSMYLGAAESIWNGHGFGLRGADEIVPLKMHNPGLAFVLAPVVGLFGFDYGAVKLAMVLLAALAALACYDATRLFLGSRRDAGVATLLVMAAPAMFRLGHEVLAEVPLLLFCMLALSSAQRYLREEEGVLSPWLWATAGSTAAAYLFKAWGLSVLLGACLLLPSRAWRTPRREQKLLLWSVMVAVPVLAWQWRCLVTPSVGFYGRSMLDWYWLSNPYDADSPLVTLPQLAVRVRHVLRAAELNVASALVAPLDFLGGRLIGVLLAAPVAAWLAVAWLRSWRNPGLVEGWLLVGAAALVFKHQGGDPRYWAVLFPALLILALRSVAAWRGARWREVAARALVALALASSAAVGVAWWSDPYGSPQARDFDRIASVARATFPASSRGLAPMAGHWRVLTGHACAGGAAPDPARADYAVVLVDPARWPERPPGELRNDLIREALQITRAVARDAHGYVEVAENASFRLVRWVR